MCLILIEDPENVATFRKKFKKITGKTVDEFKQTAVFEQDQYGAEWHADKFKLSLQREYPFHELRRTTNET